jgi:hypothetical protein
MARRHLKYVVLAMLSCCRLRVMDRQAPIRTISIIRAKEDAAMVVPELPGQSETMPVSCRAGQESLDVNDYTGLIGVEPGSCTCWTYQSAGRSGRISAQRRPYGRHD